MIRYQSAFLLLSVAAILTLSCAHKPPIPQPRNLKNLDVVMLCERDTFFVHETIWLDIMVINNEPDTLEVWYPACITGKIDFEAFCDTLRLWNGKCQHSSVVLPPSCSKQRLAPGDTAYNIVEFDPKYDVPLSAKVDVDTLPPMLGRLEITCVYNGLYSSNTVVLNFVKPNQAGTELGGIWDNMHSKSVFEHYKRSGMKQILDLYPGSYLAADACGKLIRLVGTYNGPSPQDRSDSLHKYAELLLAEYPFSGYSVKALGILLSGLSESGRSERLDQLAATEMPWRLQMIIRTLRQDTGFLMMQAHNYSLSIIH